MSEHDRTVDVWVGRFGSRQAFDQYFDEQHEDDDAPLSPFAHGQGQARYDHDFVERSFRGPTRDFDRLIDRHSHAESFEEAASRVFVDGGLGERDSVVLAFDGQVESPRSVTLEDAELTYLGRFVYRLD
ncbi:MAG: immunity 22 family protein [Acidobacteriota bacterium]